MVRGNGQGWQYLLPPQLSAGFTSVDEWEVSLCFQVGEMDPDCCLGLWLWLKQQFSIYTLFGFLRGNTRECPFSNNYTLTQTFDLLLDTDLLRKLDLSCDLKNIIHSRNAVGIKYTNIQLQ